MVVAKCDIRAWRQRLALASSGSSQLDVLVFVQVFVERFLHRDIPDQTLGRSNRSKQADLAIIVIIIIVPRLEIS